jgi:hypothetical protein
MVAVKVVLDGLVMLGAWALVSVKEVLTPPAGFVAVSWTG